MKAPAGWTSDWHPSSAGIMFFVLSGEWEVTASNGETRRFCGGQCVAGGRYSWEGHSSRVTSDGRRTRGDGTAVTNEVPVPLALAGALTLSNCGHSLFPSARAGSDLLLVLLSARFMLKDAGKPVSDFLWRTIMFRHIAKATFVRRCLFLPLALLAVAFFLLKHQGVEAQAAEGSRLLRTPTVSATQIAFAMRKTSGAPRAGGNARRLTSFQDRLRIHISRPTENGLLSAANMRAILTCMSSARTAESRNV